VFTVKGLPAPYGQPKADFFVDSNISARIGTMLTG